jgi:hypothetical protein
MPKNSSPSQSFIMKNFFQIFIVTVVLFVSCKPAQRITTAWTNPERPKKAYSTVFVAAIIQNNLLKYALEDDLGAAAKKRGFKVVKGYEIFPSEF